MLRQDSVHNLGNDRLAIADDAGKKFLIIQQLVNQVLAQLVLDGHRTIFRFTQLPDGSDLRMRIHGGEMIGLLFAKATFDDPREPSASQARQATGAGGLRPGRASSLCLGSNAGNYASTRRGWLHLFRLPQETHHQSQYPRSNPVPCHSPCLGKCLDLRLSITAICRPISYDARHRKQYRYHPRWREVRDGNKFDRICSFGKLLPKIRRTTRRHLALPALPREKVLATLVRVTMETFIRVSNEEYAKSNHSYGLTTLRLPRQNQRASIRPPPLPRKIRPRPRNSISPRQTPGQNHPLVPRSPRPGPL